MQHSSNYLYLAWPEALVVWGPLFAVQANLCDFQSANFETDLGLIWNLHGKTDDHLPVM
jgi:hypothetical protein